MKKRNLILSTVLALALMPTVAGAQTPDSAVNPGYASHTAVNVGWMGLIGLLGLMGLRREHRHTTTNPRI